MYNSRVFRRKKGEIEIGEYRIYMHTTTFWIEVWQYTKVYTYVRIFVWNESKKKCLTVAQSVSVFKWKAISLCCCCAAVLVLLLLLYSCVQVDKTHDEKSHLIGRGGLRTCFEIHCIAVSIVLLIVVVYYCAAYFRLRSKKKCFKNCF